MRLPPAALHKLVRPVLRETPQLAPAQRAVLDGAFGVVDAPARELFQVAMAALDLLAEVATRGPVAVPVDDTQWLDRSSAEVLTFIALRLGSDPVLLLVTARSVEEDPLAGGALPELRLGALDEASSIRLLAGAAPAISPAGTRRDSFPYVVPA